MIRVICIDSFRQARRGVRPKFSLVKMGNTP
jgi:hypothetical protein